MSGGQNKTPRGVQADTGQENRYANAAGTLNLSHDNGDANRARLYYVIPRDGGVRRCHMTGHRLVIFAASLDPIALASVGIVSARIWGALT
jgi:hypothetical protein